MHRATSAAGRVEGVGIRRTALVLALVSALLAALLPNPPAAFGQPGGFTDVSDANVHAANIDVMAEAGVVAGFPDGTFRPGLSITRGQLASLLARAEGLAPAEPPYGFTDIAGSVHAGSIQALADAGIVEGFPDGTFGVGAPIRRDQTASLLARWLELDPLDAGPFTDVATTSVHAAAINAVADAGIMVGVTDTTFAPGRELRRDQTASVLSRALTIPVMTRNLYLGSELGGLFAAQTEEQLVAAASEVWANVLASDFPARAEILAEEVAQDRPLLIGLQEVSLFTAVAVEGGGTATIDFLEILLDALDDAGLAYEPVSISEAFAGTLPAIDPDLGFVQATLVDRDVVLARTDVSASQLTILDEDTGLFDAALELPVLGAPLRIDRGWNLVDVEVRDRTFRFVNSHFEAFDPGEVIRSQQAQELLAGPLATDLPVVLLGDFNSDANAGGLAYGLLIGGGFEDVWTLTNPGEPGLTCCHDADLRNEEVELRSRIDLILIRDGIRARGAAVIGIDPAMRTDAGLWPSDHAGVVAGLVVTAR
jgi:hypothetical protein